MSDFISRLQEEKNELHAKKLKLKDFLLSKKTAEIDSSQLMLMYMQLSAMEKYYSCLNLRLSDLEKVQR